MAAERVELVGLDNLVRLLVNAGREVVPTMGRALTEEGQLIFRRSQFEVPIDTRVLRNSGEVLPTEVHGNQVDVWLGYGGAASLYAMWMHEGTYANGTKQYNFNHGKKAHYLSDPMTAAAKQIDARLTTRMALILSGY